MDSFILDIGVSPSTRGKFFKKVSKILEKKNKKCQKYKKLQVPKLPKNPEKSPKIVEKPLKITKIS